jgi:hypothetical protein
MSQFNLCQSLNETNQAEMVVDAILVSPLTIKTFYHPVISELLTRLDFDIY